jgi:hypothetical protein
MPKQVANSPKKRGGGGNGSDPVEPARHRAMYPRGGPFRSVHRKRPSPVHMSLDTSAGDLFQRGEDCVFPL